MRAGSLLFITLFGIGVVPVTAGADATECARSPLLASPRSGSPASPTCRCANRSSATPTSTRPTPSTPASRTRATRPRDAYRFARGEPIGIQPYDEQGRALRSVRLEQPLDFTAVTDHSEMLGDVSLCMTPGSPGYDSDHLLDPDATVPRTSPSASSPREP